MPESDARSVTPYLSVSRGAKISREGGGLEWGAVRVGGEGGLRVEGRSILTLSGGMNEAAVLGWAAAAVSHFNVSF